MSGSSDPVVSVVIATRGRPVAVAAAVRSVMGYLPDSGELIVVDQSAGDATEAGLREHRDREGFTYLRCTSEGVSRARNEGIAAAHGEWVFVLDDDCEVYPDTLLELFEALREQPDAGIVFGNVQAASHDSSQGFVPAYVRTAPFLARGIGDKLQVEGLSACMAIRKDVWFELQGFDEALGAGARMKSGAETDFTLRCLLAGTAVLETPRVRVLHHGFRIWEEGRALAGRYWYGTGAAFGRSLRRGEYSVVAVMGRLLARWLHGERSPVAASMGRRRRDVRMVVWFVRGFTRTVFTRV